MHSSSTKISCSPIFFIRVHRQIFSCATLHYTFILLALYIFSALYRPVLITLPYRLTACANTRTMSEHHPALGSPLPDRPAQPLKRTPGAGSRWHPVLTVTDGRRFVIFNK